jgi:hypothetical protein
LNGAKSHQTLKLLARTHTGQALTGGAKKVFKVFKRSIKCRIYLAFAKKRRMEE